MALQTGLNEGGGIQPRVGIPALHEDDLPAIPSSMSGEANCQTDGPGSIFREQDFRECCLRNPAAWKHGIEWDQARGNMGACEVLPPGSSYLPQ